VKRKIIIEIEVLRSGQPKDYADSVYEAIYVISDPDNNTWIPERDTVLHYVRANYNEDFTLRGEGVGPHTFLHTLERIVENRWRVIIVSPWKD
jgi:hypothetical protein